MLRLADVTLGLLAAFLLVATIAAPQPARAQSCTVDCDAIHAKQKAELEKRHAAARTAATRRFQDLEADLRGGAADAAAATRRAHGELIDPASDRRAACRKLYRAVEAQDRQISEMTDRLRTAGDGFDALKTRIDAAQARRDKDVETWRACRDKALDSIPGYDVRQKRYLEAVARQNGIVQEAFDSVAERKAALARLDNLHRLDLDWLDELRRQCRATGVWPARIRDPLAADCACRLNGLLRRLKARMAARQEAEAAVDRTAAALERDWRQLIDSLTEAARKVSPSRMLPAWEFANLALDFGFNLADTLHKGREAAEAADQASDTALHWIAGGGRAARTAVTRSKPLLDAATTARQAAARNKGAITGAAKSLAGGNAALETALTRRFAAVFDRQAQLAGQLATREDANVAEQDAWTALLAAECLKAYCGGRDLIAEARATARGLGNMGADGTGSRVLRARAFGDTSPHAQGLLATGRNCDLCGALGRLAALHALSAQARTHVADLQKAITDTQRTIGDLNRRLVGNLQRPDATSAGRGGTLMTAALVGSSFVMPWATFAASVYLADMRLEEHEEVRLPFEADMKARIARLSGYAERNAIDLIYWRSNVRRLDGQILDLLNRIAACAGKVCNPDDTAQACPDTDPVRVPDSATNALQREPRRPVPGGLARALAGCWHTPAVMALYLRNGELFGRDWRGYDYETWLESERLIVQRDFADTKEYMTFIGTGMDVPEQLKFLADTAQRAGVAHRHVVDLPADMVPLWGAIADAPPDGTLPATLSAHSGMDTRVQPAMHHQPGREEHENVGTVAFQGIDWAIERIPDMGLPPGTWKRHAANPVTRIGELLFTDPGGAARLTASGTDPVRVAAIARMDCPAVQEEIQVTVTESGARNRSRLLTLQETGPASGVFLSGPAPILAAGDSLPGNRLRANLADPLTGTALEAPAAELEIAAEPVANDSFDPPLAETGQ